jgi:UDP:flavonoid glycosyltransferase YjiC (YdhE family)
LSEDLRKVLVSPLNWGLGHASRCIPIIQGYLKKGADVHVASDGDALKLLQNEFPELTFHSLPGYEVKYGDESGLIASLVFQVPGLMKNISAEYMAMQKLQEQENFDLIISDNRPGIKSKKTKSVYLTHQLQFKVKFGGKLAGKMHQMMYKDFDEVWVPDVESPNSLAGELSQSNKPKVKYIGHLSRAQNVLEAKIYDVLLLLSGPEPQRSKLEDELYRQLKSSKLKVALVRGTSVPRLRTHPKFKIIDLANAKEIDQLVAQSKVVVARTGYSTLMDLSVWKRPCLLIPTPGQPEQEYLGNYLSDNKWAKVVNQKNLNIVEQLEEIQKFGYLNFTPFSI